MATILDTIIASKRREIDDSRKLRPEASLRDRLPQAPPVRDFFTPLAAGKPIRLIAEVKKASPSKGVIREDFDPVEIALTYERHGATCLSVLTDSPFFQGSLENLSRIRRAVSLPLLRKDFILEAYQVYEARLAGADAVLLIAECLDDCQLRGLHNLIVELGMTPLVELYEPANLNRVFDAGATLIGINNRDLRTFEVDLAHSIAFRPLVPDQCVLVAESGIRGRADAIWLEDAGIDAMLVGETLIAHPDIGAAVDALLGK